MSREEAWTPSTVAIVGAGSIGVAFAIVFARAGFSVQVQDPNAERRAAAPQEIAARLADLAEFGLLQEAAPRILDRVMFTAELAEVVAGADLVQECAPERLKVKRQLFAELDRLAPPSAVLASSSSAIRPSAIAADLPGQARCLVAHPGNPPYLLSVIEIVPAVFTSTEAISRTAQVFEHAGMTPILVRKEVEGFVFNRLQGALLREAYCLVRDGVASVEDIDRIVRDGLGLRWSVIGPFETADLNTRGGIASHAEKMGPAYARMGAERGQNDPWTPELVGRVEQERRARLPLDHWAERVAWRDRMLMAMLECRRRHNLP
jgi:3-hydroxyacyl-CoA dehydrogenase